MVSFGNKHLRVIGFTWVGMHAIVTFITIDIMGAVLMRVEAIGFHSESATA